MEFGTERAAILETSHQHLSHDNLSERERPALDITPRKEQGQDGSFEKALGLSGKRSLGEAGSCSSSLGDEPPAKKKATISYGIVAKSDMHSGALCPDPRSRVHTEKEEGLDKARRKGGRRGGDGPSTLFRGDTRRDRQVAAN